MSSLACLNLVHSSAQRHRYRIISATTINWAQVERHLNDHLPPSAVRARVNPHASSVVLAVARPLDHELEPADAASTTLRQGWQVLVAALDAGGATPPPPPLIRIKTTTQRHRPSAVRHVAAAVFNGASALTSVMLLLLAALMLVLGLVGLLLPLAPGAPLLLLAYLMVELALLLRRPFVAPMPA